jgi:hypothetical protein
MRRIIDVLSILGLVVAPVSVGLAYTNTHTPKPISVSQANLQKFPLNQPRLVEFQTDLAGFKQFSDRQQKDQIRDWLLLTVLANQGLSAKEINQATYDLPTARYDFMQPVSNFEYGETRSLYIGKGRAVVLVPKSASQAERKSILAPISDRHRKNLGETPTSLVVFEYEIHPDKHFAFLTRKGTLDIRKLFSSKYRNYEDFIASLNEFQHFMPQIDYMTSCTLQDNTLILSGHKTQVYSYLGQTEDISAFLKSEEKIERKVNGLDAPEKDENYGLSELQKDHLKSKYLQKIGFVKTSYKSQKAGIIDFKIRNALRRTDDMNDLNFRLSFKKYSKFTSGKPFSKTLNEMTFGLKRDGVLCSGSAQTKVGIQLRFPFIPKRLPIPARPRILPMPVRPEPLPIPMRPEPLPTAIIPESLLVPVRPEPLPTAIIPESLPTAMKPESLPTAIKPEPLPTAMRPESLPTATKPEPLPEKRKDLPDLSRRSNIKYNSISNIPEGISFQTWNGTTFSLKTIGKTLSTTKVRAKVGIRLRKSDIELKNQVFTRNVSHTKSGLKIDISIGDTEFGTFSSIETTNGFEVGFFSRDIDIGYSLAHRLRTDPRTIEVVLKEIAEIESVFKSSTYPPDYTVKLFSSNRWLKLTEDLNLNDVGRNSRPPEPPNNWQMRVGDLGDNSRRIRLDWLDDKAVQKKIENKEIENIHKAEAEFKFKDKFKFNKNRENPKYQEIAQRLVDNYSDFYQFRKEYLKSKIKSVDRKIKAEEYSKADKILDRLIKIYGSDPDLILRRAIIKIRKKILNVNQIFPEITVGKNNFLDEINGLLDNGTFRFSRIETDKAFIYFQNHPGLHNIDWNIPFDRSIPSGAGARVYQVMPGKIGEIELYLSGFNDSSASFHESTQFQDLNGTYVSNIPNSLSSLSSSKANNNDCNTANGDNINLETKCLFESRALTKPTYFVIVPNNS